MMEEPPILLDGARVLEYAVFDRTATPAGHTSFIVGGVPLDLETVRGLVIAENLVEGGVLLLHCSERWESLAGGHYGAIESARESAERGYSGVMVQWKPFRELTKEELAEVEAVRTHLRELAAEYPNE
jgi:hypothetical protein